MTLKVAINGFGRIGRLFMRIALEKGGVDVVAVNSNAGAETLCHLLKYDSVHGAFRDVSFEGNGIITPGGRVKTLSFKSPSEIPWGDLGVGTVVEGTGLFRDECLLQRGIQCGAGSLADDRHRSGYFFGGRRSGVGSWAACTPGHGNLSEPADCLQSG